MMVFIQPELQPILEQPAAWLPVRPAHGMIVISSRIRLARNIGSYPFPLNASPAVREKIMGLFQDALKKMDMAEKWSFLNINDLNDYSIALLFERKLISREFRNRTPGRVLAVSPVQNLSVMINEEDHLRMQYYRPGGHLREIWRKLSAFDEALEKVLPCAFLPGLGYATSCPSNLGTGLRASVMLHLPALTILDRIKTVLRSYKDMGLTARGLYGEGSEILGNLYQVSNQTTLGETVEQIISRLEGTISATVEQEIDARKELMNDRTGFLKNICARAYGMMKYAYLMSSKEALNLLSLVRMGSDCGLFPSIRPYDINRLMLLVQPAHLVRLAGKTLSPDERAAFRAALLRKIFNGSGQQTQQESSSDSEE